MKSSRSIISSSILVCSLSSSTAFTTVSQNCNYVAMTTSSSQPLTILSAAESSKPSITETDESSEYEYNEVDFADYTSDYSDVDTDDLMDIDFEELNALEELELYPDYNDIGGYDISPFEKHAREVFLTYADVVKEGSNSDEEESEPSICMEKLYSMLLALDIEATEEESKALFKYLDIDGGGSVTLDEFLPWYAEAIDASQQTSIAFENLVKSRRTVHKFDSTEVDDGVLRRAIECAIAAPNRRGNEPWRFIKLGKETVAKVVELREELNNKNIGNSKEDNAKRAASGVDGSFVSWTKVPHWIVVTYPKAAAESGPDGKMQQREDFKSVSCAVQNFMLSMWSEGIGTKWTDGPIQRTPEFANICNIDLEKEKVAGVIWYGFAKGGLNRADAKFRAKGVEEVLDVLP